MSFLKSNIIISFIILCTGCGNNNTEIITIKNLVNSSNIENEIVNILEFNEIFKNKTANLYTGLYTVENKTRIGWDKLDNYSFNELQVNISITLESGETLDTFWKPKSFNSLKILQFKSINYLCNISLSNENP